MNQLVVSLTSSDTNATGSEANPYATLEQALRRAKPGDEVLLREGEYRQFTKVAVSGKPEAPIKVTNYPNETACLMGAQSRPGILQIDASHIVLENLAFSPLYRSKEKFAWIDINSGAKGVVLRSLSLFREGKIDELSAQGFNDYGIIVEAPGVTIEDCRLIGMGKGIHIKGKESTGVTVTDCHIGPTIQSNLVIGTSYNVVRGALIAHNLLEGSYREDGIQLMQNFDAVDKAADVSNFGSIIYGNTFRNHNENAIDLKGAGQVVIDGNLITRIMGSNNGLAFGGNRRSMGAIVKGAHASSRQVLVRNNVVYNSSGGTWFFDDYKIHHNVFLWNMLDYSGSGSTYRDPKRTTFVGLKQGLGVVRRVGIKNNLIGLHEEDIRLLAGRSEIDMAGNLFIEQRKTLASILANPEPLTDNHVYADFLSKPGSSASGVGEALTTTAGSGSGRNLSLHDAGYFTDWFGRNDLPPEIIWLGDKSYRVVAVDYAANTVELDKNATWTDNTPVFWRSAKPNLGLQPDRVELAPPPPPPPPTDEVVRFVLEFTAKPGQAELLRELLRNASEIVE